METLTEMHEVRARKPHRCSWCGKRISKGEEHRVGTFKGDGVYDWRECRRCGAEVAAYEAAADPVDGYTGESFMCWLEEERPETFWRWALEDAKVARSELGGRDDLDPSSRKYEQAAASCRVAECEHRLALASRAPGAGRAAELEDLLAAMKRDLDHLGAVADGATGSIDYGAVAERWDAVLREHGVGVA